MSTDPTDLLALARAYMALPGVPRPFSTPGHGAVWVRSEDTGIRWCWDMYEHRWLPDLTDDATGGVMLGMLGLHGFRVSRQHPARPDSPWYADLYFSDRIREAGQRRGAYCVTLAEACARVAVALGRAA